MPGEESLLPTLRRYWGYESFRPLQQSIVRSLLGNHDTCVVMPTGGGKSLCYQLPAAMLPQKTVVVVSPLISLMQDQVAQLDQMGIPSALLNSSLPADQQSIIMRQARAGAYRLLYLSPERLSRPDTLEWLQRVPVCLFAIDEAHCISEWGHEFRPEYRQLSRLRLHFPEQPIAAFTASATQRVRHDIIAQLQLQNAHRYIASFYRSNLRYIVRQCDAQTQPVMLLAALRKYQGSNVIIYAPTISLVGKTVSFLATQGIAALPYHGQMDSITRRRNQEAWMSDEVPVLVGTVAFGLGINKSAVRAVIHLSMPKSIEQYYQEAGRAGRDGEPADCLMLWQKRDVGLLTHFIEQVTDPAERQRSWQRYHGIRAFVESSRCRHLQICTHFGETPKWQTCQACDVCGCETDWLQPPEPMKPAPSKLAQGAPSPPGPALATPPGAKQKKAARHATFGPLSPRESELREHLRQWRRDTARETNLPAFVIMHDSTLDDLSRKQPNNLAGLLKVSGIGELKCERYGPQILQALKDFQSQSES